MTQFSRTPLITGARPGLNARNLSGTELADALRSDPLQVFNPPASTAINEGADLAELRRAFGLVGNVVQAVGGIAQEERERDARLDEGLAAAEAKPQAYQWQEDIANGTIQPPAKNLGAFAKSFIDEHIRTVYGDRSDAFKKKYAEMLFEPFARSLASKRAEIVQRDRKVAIDGLGDIAYRAGTTEDVGRAVQGARDLGLADQEAYAATVLPAMKTAASIGDDKKFEMLAKSLPDGMFATDVAISRKHLEAAAIARKNADYAQGEDFLQAMWDQNVPSDLMRTQINGLHERGGLAPGVKAKWMKFLDDRDERQQYEADLMLGESIVVAARTGTPYTGSLESLRATAPKVYDRILPHVQRAEKEYVTNNYVQGVQSRVQAGVPLASVVDEEIELPSGGKITVSGAETQERVMQAELNRINDTSDMATRLPRVIDWSRDNGVYPPEIDRELKIGVSQAGQVAIGGQPSPATMNALNTWKVIQERDPYWGRGATDPKTRRFLDAALNNMKVAGNDPAVAIRLAVEAASVSEDVQAFRRKQVLDKVVERTGRNTLGLDISSRNSHQVLERLRSIAEAKADFGMPADLAVEEAAKEIKASTKLINGAYVNMDAKGMTPELRDNFEQLSMSIIKEYVGQSGDSTDDFTFELVPGRDDLWSVRKRGIPAADPQRKFTFTSAGLLERFDAEMKANREAGKDKIVSGIRSREARQSRNLMMSSERTPSLVAPAGEGTPSLMRPAGNPTPSLMVPTKK